MLSQLVAITRRAHQEILDVYNSNFRVDTKSDNTPITDADRRAHDVIMEGLIKIDPSIPVLSEEGQIPPFEERRNWDRLWIVDPLDGTREFTERNDEFTVNIALIERGTPKLGVVGIPTKEVVYTGDVEHAVAMRHKTDYESQISTSHPADCVRMITSRHYTTTKNQQIIDYLESTGMKVQVNTVGSSIKMCYIAEGQADIYVRFGLSNEWDIAAAHAVLRAAGGGVYSLDGTQKVYNQSESTLNSAFFACSSLPEEWSNIIALSGVLPNDS
ncbi:MAG: 3'(2'),5'-bisphosphate nucleotidase CysQ [Gammaproteobacteria bacterium]|nr:3'(2'),5'-bisphosphate nucleotidase CysQ [Gammaproteobacteria bacterium]MYC25559.1 3'(2'),5'-bisphosphate nucleotidase CysQ [Gammaproteobacteria bacterium]